MLIPNKWIDLFLDVNKPKQVWVKGDFKTNVDWVNGNRRATTIYKPYLLVIW